MTSLHHPSATVIHIFTWKILKTSNHSVRLKTSRHCAALLIERVDTGDEGPTFAPPLLPTSDKLCHPSILGSEFMEETIILHAAQCSSSNSSCANDQEPNFQPIAWATPSISGLVSPAIAVHESTRLMSDASDSTTSSFEGKGVPFHPGIPESNVVVPTDCINTVAFPSVFTPRASSNLNYLQMQHHKQPGHLDPRYISRRSNGNERASEEHTPIRGGKRGPFKDPELRKQTAQTRKRGSCIRCRMQRIRVSCASQSLPVFSSSYCDLTPVHH